MKEIIQVIVHFRMGRREEEAKDYFEGFIGQGYTKSQAVKNALDEIKIKRDYFERKHNFVEVKTIERRELSLLPRKVQNRIRDDWQLKMHLL